MTGADKRREPHPAALVYYSTEDVEALARALADGRHRHRPAANDQERAEGRQDAEIVPVAAYSGLRQGELLALHWRDVDFTGHALTISRAISAGVEGATKSGKVRRVTMPDQAAAAVDRLSRRDDFTGADELVFCNVLGRALDGSARRRRFKRARDAAGLRPLRFHDLRHTYGSLLAAAGVDLVTIQAGDGSRRTLHDKPLSTRQACIPASGNIHKSVFYVGGQATKANASVAGHCSPRDVGRGPWTVLAERIRLTAPPSPGWAASQKHTHSSPVRLP